MANRCPEVLPSRSRKLLRKSPTARPSLPPSLGLQYMWVARTKLSLASTPSIALTLTSITRIPNTNTAHLRKACKTTLNAWNPFLIDLMWCTRHEKEGGTTNELDRARRVCRGQHVRASVFSSNCTWLTPLLSKTAISSIPWIKDGRRRHCSVLAGGITHFTVAHDLRISCFPGTDDQHSVVNTYVHKMLLLLASLSVMHLSKPLNFRLASCSRKCHLAEMVRGSGVIMWYYKACWRLEGTLAGNTNRRPTQNCKRRNEKQ